MVGVAAIAFLSLFALDVFEPGAPIAAAFVGLAVHLIPSLVLVVILVVAWRWPLAGGLLFLAASMAPFLFLSNRAAVNLMLAAPFALTGLLFVACHQLAARRRNSA